MAKPELLPNEREIATYRANRTQGSRAVGGQLLLTNLRLVFCPHKLDNATGGSGWECMLAAVRSTGMSPRGFNPFNGSVRRRLQIECDVGIEYFVVNSVTTIAEAIERARSA